MRSRRLFHCISQPVYRLVNHGLELHALSLCADQKNWM
jgi:hypothetical protein